MTTPFRHKRPTALAVGVLALAALGTGTGCQQKMAQQPYYKPYEPTESFPDGRSNRPLEPGTISRGQRFDNDPLMTGLTKDEWKRSREQAAAAPKVDVPNDTQNRETAFGAPRFDPKGGDPKVYVSDYPIAIGAPELRRGQEVFLQKCAMCHGPLGNGNGKIRERGYLNPTSFHTEKVDPNEPNEPTETPLGFSRGYWRWGVQIPLREVPPGYVFEVITKGYGGMPNYAAQIPPADRWKVTAYVRALQLSQHPAAGGNP